MSENVTPEEALDALRDFQVIGAGQYDRAYRRASVVTLEKFMRQEAHASKIKELKDEIVEAARAFNRAPRNDDAGEISRLEDAVDAYEEALRSLSVEGVVE